MLGGIGVPELIIILVVVLIIFGPKNLPKLGASIGKTVKNFKKESEDTSDAVVSDEAQGKSTVPAQATSDNATKGDAPAASTVAPQEAPADSKTGNQDAGKENN